MIANLPKPLWSSYRHHKHHVEDSFSARRKNEGHCDHGESGWGDTGSDHVKAAYEALCSASSAILLRDRRGHSALPPCYKNDKTSPRRHREPGVGEVCLALLRKASALISIRRRPTGRRLRLAPSGARRQRWYRRRSSRSSSSTSSIPGIASRLMMDTGSVAPATMQAC
jgi:hypothetical protein